MTVAAFKKNLSHQAFHMGIAMLALATALAASTASGQSFMGQSKTVSSAPNDRQMLKTVNPALLFMNALGGTPEAPTVIELNPKRTYQHIEGFGASLTEASAINLLKLNPKQKRQVLRLLFDRKEGAALNILRIPMGSSDLSDGAKGEYTYCDTPGNVPDLELNCFSMARDLKTLNLLKEIKAINPELKIMINPWSAPAWLKDNKHLYGGRLESKYMEVLAEYFIRTIQVYHTHGLEVHYVGIQNEPGISIQYPSMLMSDQQQAQFIQILGKRLKEEGFIAGIIANDDNYIAMDRVKRLTTDPETAPHIKAAGFHCWSNDPEKLETLPLSIMTFETECGGNIGGTNFPYDFHWWNHIRVVRGLNRNLSAIIAWNLVSDEFAGPLGAGPQGCKTCRGLVVVRGDGQGGSTLELNSELYALMHASKYLKRGALRIESRSAQVDKLHHSAFRNPDGSYAVLLNNWDGPARNVEIRINGKEVGSGLIAENGAATILIAKP